jgi:Family of unknown function (DUF6155)
MAKSKLTDLKKLIAEMSEDELRLEIIKLYTKLPQVKDFYNQDLMTEEERQVVLKTYKDKIYKQFRTSSGNARGMINNTTIRGIVSDYEKIAVFPYDVVDLLIYRVEEATDLANDYGGMAESNYNSAITAFKKAMTLVKEYGLMTHFEDRCKIILMSRNIDFWYIEQLEELFDAARD